MNIISLDLEMSQPSRKIIQIGYIISNVKNQKTILTRSLIVNPNEELSPDIIKLTGITQDQVNNGSTLHQAYDQLVKDITQHNTHKHVFQWGLDHYELRNQLGLKWEDYIFRPRSHDIKSYYQLYQIVLPNGKTVTGLKQSLVNIGLTWNYTHGVQHDALADAHNTLLLFYHISDKMKKMNQIERILNEEIRNVKNNR